jgi:hypothetical protein
MALTGTQQLILLGVLLGLLVYLVYMQKENLLPVGDSNDENDNNSQGSSEDSDTQSSSVVSSINIEDESLTQADSDKVLLRKMTNKNSAKQGEYKTMNYAEGGKNRDNSISNLDQFFEQGNPLNAEENGGFMPNDTSDGLAQYNGAKLRTELSDEEKFNASALLPKEERQDWFEDVTPQKIKNRHLINIYRPIGVNTVITSRKNGSLDLRGNPVNPKTFVSPFLNSSIDPDVNARGICT